ncbi:MAG: formyltransferase family protein [Chloroflexota bacterium]
MQDSPLRIVYGGDRDISVRVLEFLRGESVRPLVLMVAGEKRASHSHELRTMCSHLPDTMILRGTAFRSDAGRKLLRQLEPDYIICVHFPYLIPKEVLKIPRYGVLNLHPACLPYNRGWHTATWAIMDKTPYGATLHFMSEELDAGDIICRREIRIQPGDTADSLYRRVKRLELEVFKEAWPSLVSGSYHRQPQTSQEGTDHKKEDIKSIQPVDLNMKVVTGDFIRRLRALTTNDVKEAAFFEYDGKKYYLQIKITEDTDG